jgi:DNA-directed RNA polymerase subunit M/transcription elongation factor TFIIS
MDNKIFDFRKEYIKLYDFVSQYSNDIKYDLIKYAEKNVNKKDAIDKICKYVKYINIATNIEKGIFEHSLIIVTVENLDYGYFESVYNEKLYDICINLDINNKKINNNTLLGLVLRRELDPNIVAFLTPADLNPMRWKDVVDKMRLKYSTLSTMRTTDMYKCKKCGERKFKVSEMQTRCADEPSTKFYVCLVCCFTFTKN